MVGIKESPKLWGRLQNRFQSRNKNQGSTAWPVAKLSALATFGAIMALSLDFCIPQFWCQSCCWECSLCITLRQEDSFRAHTPLGWCPPRGGTSILFCFLWLESRSSLYLYRGNRKYILVLGIKKFVRSNSQFKFDSIGSCILSLDVLWALLKRYSLHKKMAQVIKKKIICGS